MINCKAIIFPRWLFPYNLGDSIMFTAVPKYLKDKGITPLVFTYGQLEYILKLNGDCTVATPIDRMFRTTPDQIIKEAMSEKKSDDGVRWIYPEWHPKLWKFWNQRFDYFSEHPGLNLIGVNYMLQLGIEDQINDSTDFRPIINVKAPKRDHFTIGIVPDTKLANRAQPHPGCDGIGFRLGGQNGKQYWSQLVNLIKEINGSIEIFEFSANQLGLGLPIGHVESWVNLAYLVSSLHLGILSDGGMHHMFNAVNTPSILLGAQRINKPEFFRTKTDIYDSSIYKKCLNRCDIKNLTGWPSLVQNCDNSCEQIDINRIAEQVEKEYKSWKSIH